MTIPDGWTMESHGVNGVVITRPNVGGVSVDFERREYASGYVHRGRPLNKTKYTGRGWRDRLLADAVAWLQGLDK